jgi:hypothetical protein
VDPSSTPNDSDEEPDSPEDLGGTKGGFIDDEAQESEQDGDLASPLPPRRHHPLYTHQDDNDSQEDLTREVSRRYLEEAGLSPDDRNEGDSEEAEDEDSEEAEDGDNEREEGEGDGKYQDEDDDEDEDEEEGGNDDLFQNTEDNDYDGQTEDENDDDELQAVSGLLGLRGTRSPDPLPVAGRKHLMSPQLEASSK